MTSACRASRDRVSAEIRIENLRPPFVVPPSGGSGAYNASEEAPHECGTTNSRTVAPFVVPPSGGSGIPAQARGFSLVEVVLAIGIFSFAMVAILGLFGSSIGGVKKLTDRDVLVAAGSMVAEKLDTLTRSNLTNLPSGTNPTGRPTFYAFAGRTLSATNALSTTNALLAFSTNTPPAASDVAGGRLIRARIFCAQESASAEFAFGATNVSFPVRVVVDLLAPGQDNETPSMSWSFHRVLVPPQ